MEKPKNYDETVAATGEFEKLALGGHICKIKEAKIEKSKAGNEMLVIAFDIADGENKGFYQRRFEIAKKFNEKAKWSGIHRILLNDKQGNCSRYLKGFITSIENSNNGFQFNWDEKTLKDKLFGGVFGREQYKNQMGEIKWTTKLRFVRSIRSIDNADIPEDKLLKITGINDNGKATTDGEYITIDDDEELPF